jgi:hypothetical protein
LSRTTQQLRLAGDFDQRRLHGIFRIVLVASDRSGVSDQSLSGQVIKT